MRYTCKHIFTTAVLIGLILAAPTHARAHKVSIFAWVDGETVHTLSKFSGGKKVKAGTVTVFDPAGRQLLTGATDDQGEFAFKVPQQSALRVELVAGAGHKGYWIVPAEEISGIPAESPADTRADYKARPDENDRVPGGSNAQIQAAIEKAMDKKLKPVMKLLAESRQKGPSLSEILGGIGYIIGLVGLAAYFKSRKNE